MLRTLVTQLLFLNLLLASPIQKRGMQPCHKDGDCGKNECCITVFGVHECSQRPAIGEPCSPSEESVEFTSCPCQKDHVCIQGSLFAFVGGRCY